jgi:hypothetical protein
MNRLLTSSILYIFLSFITRLDTLEALLRLYLSYSHTLVDYPRYPKNARTIAITYKKTIVLSMSHKLIIY